MIDEKLKQFATDRQWEVYTTYINEGSSMKAGKLLGTGSSFVRSQVSKIKQKAAKQGYAPENDIDYPIDEAHVLKGVSSLVRQKDKEDGSAGTVMQWFKTDIDKQKAQEAIETAIEGACAGIKPVKPVAVPKDTLKDLATLYTITDFHLGMYAWGKETGDDWDIRIAEQVLMNAIGEMADGSPDSETGIFCQMGDFLHWDGLDAVTPANKNILEADTRYDLLCELAIDLCISAIDLMRKKHKEVVVYICEGNHDEAGSVWLRKAVKRHYAKEERVTIDDTSFPFYAYLHGETLLGFHHGHKVKNKSLPGLFASEPRYRPLWGQATRTYIHSGHYHHSEQDKSEDGGAIVERHNTLAARDAYATRGGWVAERRAQAITYHKTKGERSRVVVVPDAD